MSLVFHECDICEVRTSKPEQEGWVKVSIIENDRSQATFDVCDPCGKKILRKFKNEGTSKVKS